MSKLNQRDSPEEFFKEYGFTSTMSMKHPEFGGTMEFTGLESNYVQSLERETKEHRKYIQELLQKIEWLRDREFYSWKDGKK